MASDFLQIGNKNKQLSSRCAECHFEKRSKATLCFCTFSKRVYI